MFTNFNFGIFGSNTLYEQNLISRERGDCDQVYNLDKKCALLNQNRNIGLLQGHGSIFQRSQLSQSPSVNNQAEDKKIVLTSPIPNHQVQAPQNKDQILNAQNFSALSNRNQKHGNMFHIQNNSQLPNDSSLSLKTPAFINHHGANTHLQPGKEQSSGVGTNGLMQDQSFNRCLM